MATTSISMRRLFGSTAMTVLFVSLRGSSFASAFCAPASRENLFRLRSGALFSSTTSSDTTFWRSNQDCWRPDVRDVERISFGQPAKKKGTGSRGIPHRLNEDERRSFDQARRQGFLQVTGSAWRSQRRDAPLLNTYRSLSDARGKPAIVLHKLSPTSSGEHEDKLVVDLSPLRFPDEFDAVGEEVKAMIQAEYNLESCVDDVEEGGGADDEGLDIVEASDEDQYETRPIYQLPPFQLEWNVSRQEGKIIGKYLAGIFETIEKSASKSKNQRGVKPGKGRRSGGYGIG
eukprot:scaffold30121_cov170-Skeletonema_marinoi.AAC.3